jgi:CheY-like chemotaxis protein
MSDRRILIVEGDADMRAALADAMTGMGAEVLVAEDGVQALAQLRRGLRPSVILLDLRLPTLWGRDLLEDLRADSRLDRVPVITMTAGAGTADGKDVLARLQRPVDLDDLRQIVMSLFEAAAA